MSAEFRRLMAMKLKERHKTNHPDPALSLLIEAPHTPEQSVRQPRQLGSESIALPSRHCGGPAVVMVKESQTLKAMQSE